MKKQHDQQCHSTCMGCGKQFRTTNEFDRHRVGSHGLDRRCLSSNEMTESGWQLSGKIWRSPYVAGLSLPFTPRETFDNAVCRSTGMAI
jgi:hypothetical protein